MSGLLYALMDIIAFGVSACALKAIYSMYCPGRVQIEVTYVIAEGGAVPDAYAVKIEPDEGAAEIIQGIVGDDEQVANLEATLVGQVLYPVDAI